MAMHTTVKLEKKTGGQVPNSETESERTGEANDEVHNCLIYSDNAFKAEFSKLINFQHINWHCIS